MEGAGILREASVGARTVPSLIGSADSMGACCGAPAHVSAPDVTGHAVSDRFLIKGAVGFTVLDFSMSVPTSARRAAWVFRLAWLLAFSDTMSLQRDSEGILTECALRAAILCVVSDLLHVSVGGSLALGMLVSGYDGIQAKMQQISVTWVLGIRGMSPRQGSCFLAGTA